MELGFHWRRMRVIWLSRNTFYASGGNRWGTPMRSRQWPPQWTARTVGNLKQTGKTERCHCVCVRQRRWVFATTSVDVCLCWPEWSFTGSSQNKSSDAIMHGFIDSKICNKIRYFQIWEILLYWYQLYLSMGIRIYNKSNIFIINKK